VKTGVQSIAKALKTPDSGFLQNDVKKNRTDFFTPSPLGGRGKRGRKKPALQGMRNGVLLFQTFFIAPPINKEEIILQAKGYNLSRKIIYFAGICQIEKDRRNGSNLEAK
jgi:hypothetical protein